jgi:hypothetical protein
MGDGVESDYLFLQSPSRRPKFELPTINVKEVSPRLLNRYRDKRNNILNISTDSYGMLSPDMTPLKYRTGTNADRENRLTQSCTNPQMVREAARNEAAEAGEESVPSMPISRTFKQTDMLSVADVVRALDKGAA